MQPIPELDNDFVDYDYDYDCAVHDFDPLEIVLFRFLESDTGQDSFEERIALLLALLEEYDEVDDSFFFLPNVVTTVPSADLRLLGLRMLNLKARP